MKNIPVFTTSAGVATLILREIPVWGKAYILPRSVFTDLAALLEECAGFCRAAGAQQVFAQLDQPIQHAQFQCEIWQLKGKKETLGRGELALEPLTKENAADYRTLYNRCFAAVDNAASCQQEDLERLLTEGGAWLYYEDSQPLGLGQVKDGELLAIAVARKGLGYPLALALLGTCEAPELTLQVASSNVPALQLYERLGFEKERVCSRWYRIGQEQ